MTARITRTLACATILAAATAVTGPAATAASQPETPNVGVGLAGRVVG